MCAKRTVIAHTNAVNKKDDVRCMRHREHKNSALMRSSQRDPMKAPIRLKASCSWPHRILDSSERVRRRKERINTIIQALSCRSSESPRVASSGADRPAPGASRHRQTGTGGIDAGARRGGRRIGDSCKKQWQWGAAVGGGQGRNGNLW